MGAVREARAFPFRRVGMVGLGLMGGSLARALKALPDPPHLAALSRDAEDLEAGLAAGVVDQAGTDPEALLRGRDVVVYATPLEVTLRLLAEHRGVWDQDAVITDVVSLKAPLLTRAAALGVDGRFVGSHPMAGGEGRGFHASRPGLFHGTRVWLAATPAAGEVRAGVEGFWRALGGEPRWIEAGAHDRLMIWASHLPQLASNALALALEGADIPRDALGSGGKDMTRLAGSAPEMWEDLLAAAGPELPEAVETLEAALARLRRALREGRIDQVAEDMRRTRRWMREGSWS